MIAEFCLKAVGYVLTFFQGIFSFFGEIGEQLNSFIELAYTIIDYILIGWQFLNIFIPTLDVCLGMALFCLSFEFIYQVYLLIMWILKKIPVLGVS